MKWISGVAGGLLLLLVFASILRTLVVPRAVLLDGDPLVALPALPAAPAAPAAATVPSTAHRPGSPRSC